MKTSDLFTEECVKKILVPVISYELKSISAFTFKHAIVICGVTNILLIWYLIYLFIYITKNQTCLTMVVAVVVEYRLPSYKLEVLFMFS